MMKKGILPVMLLLLAGTPAGAYGGAEVLEFHPSDDASLWQNEIAALSDGGFIVYKHEADLALTGKTAVLTQLYHPALCGAYDCPFKIVEDGREMLHILAPSVSEASYVLKDRRRAFYPDILVGTETFAYDYGSRRYGRAFVQLYGEEPQIFAPLSGNCLPCTADDVPKNPLDSPLFEVFREDAAGSAGELKVSRLMLERLGRQVRESDAPLEAKAAAQAFEDYVLMLHEKLKSSGVLERMLCREVQDGHGRTAPAGYWGLLKAAYFMGTAGETPANAKGETAESYIIDGSILDGYCVDEIKAGAEDKKVYTMPEDCAQGGCIE